MIAGFQILPSIRITRRNFNALPHKVCHRSISTKRLERNFNSNPEISVKIEKSSFCIPKNPVGIIFDMDGTLIKPCIDFKEMRRQIYEIADSSKVTFGLRGDVLELVENSFSGEQQIQAKEVFMAIEKQAILDMEIMDEVVDLLRFIDDCGMKRAILTRNVGTSVIAMEEKMTFSTEEILSATFDPVIARDSIVSFDGSEKVLLPPKPEPDAILYICQQWNCLPADVIMVGDSAADDITAANRAGCSSVLLNTGKDNDSGRGSALTKEEIQEQTPTHSVLSHGEIKRMLQSM